LRKKCLCHLDINNIRPDKEFEHPSLLTIFAVFMGWCIATGHAGSADKDNVGGFQASLITFYRRFLESPNFTSWFERQRAAAWRWQEAEWAAAAAVRGEGADLDGLDEVQVVEAFFELEGALEAALTAAHQPKATSQACRSECLCHVGPFNFCTAEYVSLDYSVHQLACQGISIAKWRSAMGNRPLHEWQRCAEGLLPCMRLCRVTCSRPC
jgi:hypothetical protein